MNMAIEKVLSMQKVDALYAALVGELAGARALDTATAMARFNRITGSRDFAAAVELLAEQLRAARVGTVTVERFPIDGVQRYMGRAFAPAYEAHSARLRVVAPAAYTICDYAETPMCLPSGTPATAPEGVTAEVVDVGRGDRATDYEGIDVAGKAVMATGLTTDVYNLAVEQYGAACVMTTNMYDWSNLPQRKRSMVDLPDATHLARLYHDASKRRAAPAFSITYRHAERLRAQLAQGPVTIHASVQAESKAGDLLVLDATIQGSDLAEQEVWVLAHLCHPKPGACDNGSGVALGVEIFRAIAALIETGKLPRPRRTLRLLLLPEVSGTQAYMDRFEARMDKVVAGINLDMVGASSAATGAYCRLVQTPWSRPSFLNHLGGYLLEKTSLGATSHIRREPVRDWLYALAPYDKGSDHDVLLNSRFAIPSVFFFNWPHRFYHTDLDTPEKLDAGEFARTGAVAGTMALVTAFLGCEIGEELLTLLQTEAVHGLARLAHQQDPASHAAGDNEALLRLAAQVEMEQGALQSVAAALPPHERARLANPLAQAGASLDPWRIAASAVGAVGAEGSDARIPVRVEAWPVNLGQVGQATGKERLAALRTAVVDFDDKAIAALNYANGARSVDEIARLVAGELGEFGAHPAGAWFDLLAESGVVAWRETLASSHPTRPPHAD
jgi:aminopeptidase YwaD